MKEKRLSNATRKCIYSQISSYHVKLIIASLNTNIYNCQFLLFATKNTRCHNLKIHHILLN